MLKCLGNTNPGIRPIQSRKLKRRPLSFDLQLNPTQYVAAAELIRANPGVRVIINHLGSPTLADLTEPMKASELWEGMAALEARRAPSTEKVLVLLTVLLQHRSVGRYLESTCIRSVGT